MLTSRDIVAVAVAACLVLPPASAGAYLLPLCSIADDERDVMAEDVLRRYGIEMMELGARSSLARLEGHRRDPRIRLALPERREAQRFEVLKVKLDFWEYAVALKAALLALPGHGASPAVAEEADGIAKSVVEKLYALSQEWRVGNSAIFHNVLINIGSRKRGFCYHYVDQLRQALSARQWREFDIRWGTANGGRGTENNALVITAKGQPFESGLAIDAWRRGGRPFWAEVKRDRFDWVEELGVEIEDY